MSLDRYLSSLPEFSSPRGTFLYSSLASRKTANPTGYSSAISWWRNTLSALVAKGLLGPDHLVLVADDSLRENLRRDKIGRPTSLGTVLSELSKTGDVVPLESYLNSTGPKGASWLSVLSRPLWWSLSLLLNGVLGPSDAGESGEDAEWQRNLGNWVFVELVERAATTLIPKLAALHVEAISRLYTLPTFHAAVATLCFPGATLSERDCTVLAQYLSSKKLCVIEGEVIKFSPPLSTPSAALSVTEADHGILTLRTTLASLEAYIASIETRIAEQQVLVRQYHAKKQLGLVKSHLVSRKRLEALLADRVASRDKVSEVLVGIEKAVGSEETIAALTLGTSTLRTLLSSPTLSLDHIEATTTAFSDALADAADINQAVEAGGVALPSEDEEDVERELAEMVAESARIEEAEKKAARDNEERVEREKERVERERVQEEESVRREKETRERDARAQAREEERERLDGEDERRDMEEERQRSEAAQRERQAKESASALEGAEARRLAEEERRREGETRALLGGVVDTPVSVPEEKEQKTREPVGAQ